MSEPLVAAGIGANVWLLSSVSPHMCPQIEVQRKSFVADLAFVGLDSGVNELVSFELGVVKELLVASWERTCKHPFTMSNLVLSI